MELITAKNYVDTAEKVITGLITEAKAANRNPRNPDDYKILSTSQIRKQLAMTAELSSQVSSGQSGQSGQSGIKAGTDSGLSPEVVEKVEYLRVQFVYQAGREPLVRKFVEKSGILKILKSIKSREDLLTFCKYMEALVAFRKFHGKKDD